jgi:hypothetical protein
MTNYKLIPVALLLFALVFVAGCGGGGSSDATAKSRPKSEPPLFHEAEYDVETTWEQTVSNRKIGSYLESVWRDGASYSSKLRIASRPAEGTAPPLAAADLARIQLNWMPNYRERSFKKVKSGGHSAIRFAADAAGESRIQYFFEECGTSIVMRGSTVPIAYEPFSEFYGIVASRIKVVCDE